MYDIIGDVHGHYTFLVKLLKKMGYVARGKSFAHPSRKAVFVGDFINRGDSIKQCVRLIRAMVESGDALAILGNHELNAIYYATLDKSGKSLRKHIPRYKLPLMSTLEEYAGCIEEWENTVKWFRSLPVYLDLGKLRVVHGGWNDKHIETFEYYKDGNSKLKKGLLKEALTNPELGTALNELVRGIEFKLPDDLILKDERGLSHRVFRIKWWEAAEGKTFKEIAFANRFELPAYTVPPEIAPAINPYPVDAPPVFMGHYCLDKGPLIIRDNICCVDNCIARSSKLTAYRWDGEQVLTDKNLVQSN